MKYIIFENLQLAQEQCFKLKFNYLQNIARKNNNNIMVGKNTLEKGNFDNLTNEQIADIAIFYYNDRKNYLKGHTQSICLPRMLLNNSGNYIIECHDNFIDQLDNYIEILNEPPTEIEDE